MIASILANNWAAATDAVILVLGVLVAQRESVSRWLKPYLDKLGTGWKTIIGVLLCGLIMILAQEHIVNDDLYNKLILLAGLLFDVGIIHKESRVP